MENDFYHTEIEPYVNSSTNYDIQEEGIENIEESPIDVVKSKILNKLTRRLKNL